MRVGAELRAPEAVADHHHGRHTGLLRFQAEEPSRGGRHTQGGEVLVRDQVSVEPFRLGALIPGKRYRERHRPQQSRGRGHRLVLVAIPLEIRVGHRAPAEGRQFRGVAHALGRAHNGLNLAADRTAHADADGHGKHRHGSKPRRFGEHPQRIGDVLADLDQIHGGQLGGDVGEQPDNPGHTVLPPDLRNGIFAQTVQIGPIPHAELVGIRARQAPIEVQADIQTGIHQ